MAAAEIHEFMATIGELLRRIEDGRALITEGKYDYQRAFEMAEKQAKRIQNTFEWTQRVETENNFHEQCPVEDVDDAPTAHQQARDLIAFEEATRPAQSQIENIKPPDGKSLE